ncbi:MAG: tetratricopeptide repeat protein [Candidatus Thioglobus sp.]|nr:tetratricopeptide repeat protein [Candidatus Thioglobus sp.]MBT6655219.1 tetratricopeptide repeat protein [Candidatus Thioglobus sp.]
MKNFIEVHKTEDEQAEQIKKWIKENGGQIVAGVVMGLSAIWGFDYYKNYQNEQSTQARSHYLSLVVNPNNTESFDKLQNNYTGSGYVDQSSLLMAKNAVNNKQYQQALDYLSPLLESENEFVAHSAKLRMAAIHLEMNNYDQALSVLEATENNAFSGLYNHTKGDVYLAQNNTDSAKKHYRLALSQLSNDSELKSLIKIKLNDLN